MRHPAQSAAGGWVMPGLVLKWFPLCEFSLFDIPRVSGLAWRIPGTGETGGLLSMGSHRVRHD